MPYAKTWTKGDPSITLAALDTGVDVEYRELRGKVGKRFDFVDLNEVDSREFVGRIRGLDTNVTDEVGHGPHGRDSRTYGEISRRICRAIPDPPA